MQMNQLALSKVYNPLGFNTDWYVLVVVNGKVVGVVDSTADSREAR